MPYITKLVEDGRNVIFLDMKERYLENESLMNCRAGKLLKKDKPFVVVACDEPYYKDVYSLIRRHEKEKEDWSEHDESKFQKAMDWISGELEESIRD